MIMKNYLVVLAAIVLINPFLESQNTSDLYQKETIVLEAVSEYGENNNWGEIFSPPSDISTMKVHGLHYQIAVAPDGSVFMSDKYYPDIFKFDKEGNYIDTFNADIKSQYEFSIPEVEGIFNDSYFFTTNGYDGIQFFDFEGNHVKTLSIDFFPIECKPMGNDKVAILGYTPWENNDTKRMIVIKDFYTGDEITIWSELINYKRGEIKIHLSNGSVMNLSVPGNYPIPQLATSKLGDLIVAFPDDGDVEIYSPEGKMKEEFNLKIEAVIIEQEDIDEYYNVGKSNINRFKERLIKESNFSNTEIEEMVTQYKEQIGKLKDKSIYPDHLPYFTKVLIDSEGNLLVFRYTDKKNTNKFNVYTHTLRGKYLSTSSFSTNEFNLNFSSNTFIFHNNYIFNIAENKDSNGTFKQLVKFKVD